MGEARRSSDQMLLANSRIWFWTAPTTNRRAPNMRAVERRCQGMWNHTAVRWEWDFDFRFLVLRHAPNAVADSLAMNIVHVFWLLRSSILSDISPKPMLAVEADNDFPSSRYCVVRYASLGCVTTCSGSSSPLGSSSRIHHVASESIPMKQTQTCNAYDGLRGAPMMRLERLCVGPPVFATHDFPL